MVEIVIEALRASENRCRLVACNRKPLYVVGGWDFPTYPFLTTVEAYDPAHDTWTTKAPMPTARAAMGVGVVNGILYAIAGTGSLLTVEAYDPATDTWTTKASVLTSRYNPAVGVINDIIYVAGGDLGGGSYSNIVEAYDPGTNTWTIKAPMPTPRGNAAYGVVNSILYVAGGTSTGYSYPTSVDAYDPAGDTWSTLAAPIPTPRNDIASGVVNGVLYAAGGYHGGFLATNEAFTPEGAVCGNGIVESGEQCDDGNTLNGDCCSSCQFEATGSACPSDGNVCTLDVCNGSGACTHPPGNNGVPCDDGNASTVNDTCQDGVCIGTPANQSPVCTSATALPSTLWPPNHQLRPISISGVTDPDGDSVTITATSVFQDELVSATTGDGSGSTAPDAILSLLQVRAERNGTGDGRVYHINFTANDGKGGTCPGTVKVCVPHDQGKGKICVDGGSLYNSLVP